MLFVTKIFTVICSIITGVICYTLHKETEEYNK